MLFGHHRALSRGFHVPQSFDKKAMVFLANLLLKHARLVDFPSLQEYNYTSH